jgi:hypothetical protein
MTRRTNTRIAGAVWLIVKGVAIPIPAVATDARGERSHP